MSNSDSLARRIYSALFATPVAAFLNVFFWLVGAVGNLFFVATCLVFFPIGIPILLLLIHQHFTSRPVSDRRGSRLLSMKEAHDVLQAQKARRS